MKITARQLKAEDTLGASWGVVSASTDRATNTTIVGLISAGGLRTVVTYSANAVLTVDRAEVDGTDPLSRPYWWGLEAERERAEDRRAYAPCFRGDR